MDYVLRDGLTMEVVWAGAGAAWRGRVVTEADRAVAANLRRQLVVLAELSAESEVRASARAILMAFRI